MDNPLFESFKRRLAMVEGSVMSKTGQKGRLVAEVLGLRRRSDILGLTEKVLKHLIDRLGKADLDKMDRLVTYGLSVVFPTKDLKFYSSMEERGKRMRIALRTLDRGKEVSEDSMSSVQVVESFILRLLCMRRLRRAPFMMFDETFAAVENANIDNVGKLILQLAEKTKMDMLLVTHLPQFAEWGNHMYRVDKRGDKATVERTR